MNSKIIILTLLLLPLFSIAKANEICLGDTFEKVKGIKGFPKNVAFTKVETKVDGNSETLRFEAVTFYKDDVIYIFESSNSRLCQLSSNLKSDRRLVCEESYRTSLCE